MDDASPDGTLALAESYAARDPRVRVIAQKENGGVSRARNRGVREARGEWIAFLDSDDLWMPEKLERQIALAAQHPEAGLFFTGSAFISEDDRKYGYTLSVPERVNYRRLLGQNVISCSSVLVICCKTRPASLSTTVMMAVEPNIVQPTRRTSSL